MIEPRDEDALVEALDKLLADEGLRGRYAARNLEVVRTRVGESAPAMEALYRRLVAELAGGSSARTT